MSHPEPQQPRLLKHTEGLLRLKEDNFLSALQLLIKAYLARQGHILLLIDLASCYYMLNDFDHFHKWTLKSLEKYKLLFLKTISPNSRKKLLNQWSLDQQIEIINTKIRQNKIFCQDQQVLCSAFFKKI